MDNERIARAKELLQALEVKTCRSPVVIARRVLCAQEFLAQTRKQIEVLV